MTPILSLEATGGSGIRFAAPAADLADDTQRSAAARSAAARSSVASEFEAAMLAPMVEAMLPPADSAVWGDEGGGGIWRSLFAQEIGAQIARSGGIGLAGMVERAIDGGSGDAR